MDIPHFIDRLINIKYYVNIVPRIVFSRFDGLIFIYFVVIIHYTLFTALLSVSKHARFNAFTCVIQFRFDRQT